MIKPNLKFFHAAMPAIGIYLQHEYEQANTFEDLIKLVDKWLEEAQTSKNEVRAMWYKIAAENLFSVLTNKSFSSIEINI